MKRVLKPLSSAYKAWYKWWDSFAGESRNDRSRDDQNAVSSIQYLFERRYRSASKVSCLTGKSARLGARTFPF